MKLFRQLQSVVLGPSACAMGMFDGVHLGHQLVLEHALRAAKIHNLASVVFTFANHPQSILAQTPTALLTTLEERLHIFEQLGFDAALVLDFTPELRDLSPEVFVQRILLDALHCQAVSVGYDHRFGKNRMGDGTFLEEQGLCHGFNVTVVEPVRVGSQIVSSTLIRKLLGYGDLAKANQLLGRPYTITGRVVPGVGRGRTIGFPTANLELPPQRLLPALGVYAGQVVVEGQHYPAVCNIGHAPTFGDQPQPRMEVHVLEAVPDLYGKTLQFSFLHYLRPERSFPGISDLVAQIQSDCVTAKKLLQPV